MRDGQGCLLPVLRHYLEQEEEQHLMVHLLLPKTCKAKVVQHLYEAKSNSPSNQRKGKPRRAKPVSNGKHSKRKLDAGVMQDCLERRGAEDVVVVDDGIVAVRAFVIAPLGSRGSVGCFEGAESKNVDGGMVSLNTCVFGSLNSRGPVERADSKDVIGGMVALKACVVAPSRSLDSACIAQNGIVIPSQMAELKPTQSGNLLQPCELTSICDSSTMHNHESCKDSEEAQKDEEVVDKSYIPGLPDAVALLCLAYLPLTEHWSLALVSHKHRELVRDSTLLKLRHQHQIVDQWICIYTSGNDGWTAFNPKENRWRSLPHANVDPNFVLSDKESLAAGTHLLWLGREAFEFACYKYDLVSNGWERGPHMVNPRCLFGSASCGQYAYVAGGFSVGGLQFKVLNSAERYDSLTGTWEPLPPMNTPRQKCSGFFMDGKFYVIGGKSRNHEQLTSGEEYDPVKNTWRTIENMYSAPVSLPSFEPSPPLVAVAGNELYAIESSSNLLKVYEKVSNRWRVLGPVPVRADFCNGWGLAFKALGNQLFVIGGHRYSNQGAEGVAVFSWRPQPGVSTPEWQLVNFDFTGSGSFLFNCAVMSC